MKFLRGEDILPADTQMRNKLFQEKPSACKLRGFICLHSQ